MTGIRLRAPDSCRWMLAAAVLVCAGCHPSQRNAVLPPVQPARWDTAAVDISSCRAEAFDLALGLCGQWGTAAVANADLRPMLGVSYLPYVGVFSSDYLDLHSGSGWAAHFGFGSEARCMTFEVFFAESRHDRGSDQIATYSRFGVLGGLYLNCWTERINPYVAGGFELHDVEWGGPTEHVTGYGILASMGMDFVPNRHAFFGLEVSGHAWVEETNEEEAYLHGTIEVAVSAFIEF